MTDGETLYKPCYETFLQSIRSQRRRQRVVTTSTTDPFSSFLAVISNSFRPFHAHEMPSRPIARIRTTKAPYQQTLPAAAGLLGSARLVLTARGPKMDHALCSRNPTYTLRELCKYGTSQLVITAKSNYADSGSTTSY